jgi:uncharacterized protein YjeT (DUF2065 family)
MNFTRLLGIFTVVIGLSLLLAEILLRKDLFTALTGADPESFRLATLVVIATGLVAVKVGR